MSDTCALSGRLDGPWHTWRDDGPHLVCVFCGERRKP